MVLGRQTATRNKFERRVLYLKWIADSNPGFEVSQLLVFEFVVYDAALSMEKKDYSLPLGCFWVIKIIFVNCYLVKLSQREINVHLRFSKQFHIAATYKKHHRSTGSIIQ